MKAAAVLGFSAIKERYCVPTEPEVDQSGKCGGHSPEREIVQFLGAEQHLDQADIDLLFEQVGGERMAQGAHRHQLVDAGFVCGRVDGTVELPGAEVPDRIGFWPGNSQPPSSIFPCARATRHQTRSRSSNSGESIA